MEDEQVIQATEPAGKKQKSWMPFLVVALLLIGVVFFATQKSRVSPTTPSDQGQGKQPKQTVNNAVVVENYSAGDKVVASVVILENPGYLVIHEDNNGQPGKVLGNSELLATGENKDVVVELSRETKDGEIVHAMLHSDDGDATFNLPQDMPVLDDEGATVMASFLVGAGQ